MHCAGAQFLLGGGEIPFDGFAEILLHDLAGFVKDAEIELRRRITALGGFAIPFDGLGIILGHALAGFVEHAEIELRGGIALLGGFAQPSGGLAKFLRHAGAVDSRPQITLGHGIILVGGTAEPFDGLVIILRHALAVLITNAQIALRLRIARFGGGAHGFKSIPSPAIADIFEKSF